MKRLIAFHILILMNLSVYAQNGLENKLNPIRNWYKDVNKNLSEYQKVEYKDIDVYQDKNKKNYSSEGTNIYRLATVDMIKYFDGDELVKISVTMKGDREDLQSEYYYRYGNLVLLNKVMTIYLKPKWHEDYNKNEFSTLNDHFYFKDNKLIKWVVHKVYSVSENNPIYTDKESQILHDSELYRNFLVNH